MRVTNSLFYTNATNNYQRNMQELYKTNNQISSGLKIQNSFEDSGVYVDTMRLNYEVATLEQIKESTSAAQTYADNTDQVLNQFTDTLTQFKTKLIQAANESNSSTSLNALGNELEALRDHMISLGNTSINGQYLFSGTDVTTKPFNDDGTYNGNDGDIEAIIGSGVKLPYNLNGQDLFLGSDSEYNKILSTNVRMYNQTLLHPVGNEASQEVYLSENDTIYDLTGGVKTEVNSYDIAGAVEAGDIYTIEIDGIIISHTVTDETTSEEITTALKDAINSPLNGVDNIVNATSDGMRLTLTPIDPSSNPDITTSVTNIVNAITSSSITSTSSEVLATSREQTITFNSASSGAGDTITWWDGGSVGVGNSVTINPAQGDTQNDMGNALALAINTDLTAGSLYTASYTSADGLIVTADLLGSVVNFTGVIDSTISSAPTKYSTIITDPGGIIINPGVDTISWSSDGGVSSYVYISQPGDSVEDMLSGLVREIDTDGSAQYNAHYNTLGGGDYEFTVTSNTAGYDGGFIGQFTPSFAGLVIANNPDDLGSIALTIANNSTISGDDGAPSSSTITFTSALEEIDEGDVFEFTIDDGSGNPPVPFTYTSTASDTLENVKTNFETQLDANNTLYGGLGVTYVSTIDEIAGTLSFEIKGDYPVGTVFDGTNTMPAIDPSGTSNVNPDLQTITEDKSTFLATGETVASFYVSGRNSEGDTFSEELQLSSSAKVSDLLEEIGQLYGNTSTNKVVDVSMNDNGQIEIKDLSNGNSLLEFNIFGAIDRDAVGAVGNASQSDIDDLLAFNNVDIIEFNKSNFLTQNTASSISSKQDINNPGTFKMGAPMTSSDGLPVSTVTTLQSFMGDEVNQITFSGDNNVGVTIPSIPPNDSLNIDSATTVGDLLNEIESIYGVSARLEEGQIYLEVGDSDNYKLNQLNVKIDAFKGAGEGEIQTIDILNQATSAGDITFTFPSTPTIGSSVDVLITIENGDTSSEIATKIEEASASFIALNPNISSVRADGDRVVIDYKDTAGDVDAFLIATGTTGVNATATQIIQTSKAPNIAEVQSFSIKENLSTAPIPPTVNIITIAGQDIIINDNDEPFDIANNIKTALTALDTSVVPPVSFVPEIDSVEVSANGKVTVTYLQSVDIDSDFLKNTALHVEGLSIGEVLTEKKFEATSSVDVFSTFDSMNYERRGFEKDGNELLGNISQIIKNSNDYASLNTKLVDVGGAIDPLTNKSTLSGQEMMFKGFDINNNPFEVQINFSNSGTTFSFNDIEHDYNIYSADGTKTKADDMTYQQLSDLISVIASGHEPVVPISVENSSDIVAAIANPTETNLSLATLNAPNEEVKNHILDAINYAVLGNASKSVEALQKADLAQYGDLIKSSKNIVEVSLDYQGKLKVIDRKNSVSNIEFSLYDTNADDVGKPSSLNFMANDAIAIEEPKLNFFQHLDQMIEAVKSGRYNMDGNSDNPRNIGIQNSIAKMDHILDHVTKEHTKIGSYSNALSKANERSQLLSINIQTVRSEVIDVDIGEAYMKFNQLSNSYQAMLSTVAKINSMSLLNYM